MNPKKKKKRGARNKVLCRGFGKCMKMEMDTIEETEVAIKEECALASVDTNLNKGNEIENEINSDLDQNKLQEISNLKTIFRFKPNEKCKYKCKLQKCDNHKACGNMMPQWSLNLGRGLCDQCIVHEEYADSLSHMELLKKKRRYTI